VFSFRSLDARHAVFLLHSGLIVAVAALSVIPHPIAYGCRWLIMAFLWAVDYPALVLMVPLERLLLASTHQDEKLSLLLQGIVGGAQWVFVAQVFIWIEARSHRSLGMCPKCDYDLTANVSGTCPECGRVIDDERSIAEGSVDSVSADPQDQRRANETPP